VTESPTSRSVWEALPDYEKIRKWDRAVPNAAARILGQLEADAEFVRRDAERRLTYALILLLSTLVAVVVLALYDKTVPAIFASSGGTIGVATTLITGRAPALRRRTTEKASADSV
jgi:hypothetical protein